MSDASERADLWRLARELRDREPIGAHVEPVLLRDYVSGGVWDASTVIAIRRHLARCESCLREELRLERQSRMLVFVPKVLRGIGSTWLTMPATLAARTGPTGEVRSEHMETGDLRFDARVTPSEQLTATVSRSGAPCSGWSVRLERIRASVETTESTGTTDEGGSVTLGNARRVTEPGDTFRFVAEPPDED